MLERKSNMLDLNADHLEHKTDMLDRERNCCFYYTHPAGPYSIPVYY
jgi:hypothetical protein